MTQEPQPETHANPTKRVVWNPRTQKVEEVKE